MAKEHGLIFNSNTINGNTTEQAVSNTKIDRPVITSLLIPRTAKQRLEDAKNLPPIKQLLGPIWQTEELHILFADNGVGKSILAMQIADALSKGQNTLPILKNDNPALKVLVYDFELSDKQFELRYTNEEGEQYNFSENLLIENINFHELHNEYQGMKTDDMIAAKIEADIKRAQPDVLIIDNLTYLKTEAAQDANVALQIIRVLDRLKKQYKLSILVIAHTPKVKGDVPISKNDLAGSKHLSNLVDSVSAIGKSNRNPNEKYIKQIKSSRSAVEVFGYDNVITATITKDNNFLKFEYLDCECEKEHLRQSNNEQKQIEKQIKIDEVLRLHSEGLTFEKIEERIGVPRATAQRWIKKYGTE